MRQVQEIINSAYARQKRAQQGVDANEDTELRPQLHSILGAFFQLGARVNPEFFSVEERVRWSDRLQGWPRPPAAELIHWVETTGGTEVVRVPRDDLRAEPGAPCIYRLGQVYRPAGSPKGPEDGVSLRFIYAKRPDEPAALQSDIDAMWPRGHELLLALELAIYVAEKDRRTEDAVSLAAHRDRELTRFLAFLEHEDIGVRRRTGLARRFTSSPLVPSRVLAGTSTVEVP